MVTHYENMLRNAMLDIDYRFILPVSSAKIGKLFCRLWPDAPEHQGLILDIFAAEIVKVLQQSSRTGPLNPKDFKLILRDETKRKIVQMYDLV